MRKTRDRLKAGGFFTFKAFDKNGKLLWKDRADNLLPDAMLTAILGTIFGGGSQITTWYMGLINNSPTPSIAAGDTMGSHAGWAEVTAYTIPRPTITFGTAVSKVISSSSSCSFAMTGTVTVYGGFVTSVATQGGTTGTLAAAGALNNPQTMHNGETLQVNYSCSSASA